jgi:hypothetical protein
MAYVDLNPMGAKMTESVEQSEYTSIFELLHGNCCEQKKARSDIVGKPLFGFVAGECNEQLQGIPYSFIDYLELVDWTGRIIRDDKRGAISGQTPNLLSVLGLDQEVWLELACYFGKNYHGAVGSLEELALFADHTGKCWISGKNILDKMLH